MEGHHSSILIYECPQQDRHLRVLCVGPHAYRAGRGSLAAHLYCIDCHIWGITPRFLLSVSLPEEFEGSPHCDPHQGHHWEGCFS